MGALTRALHDFLNVSLFLTALVTALNLVLLVFHLCASTRGRAKADPLDEDDQRPSVVLIMGAQPDQGSACYFLPGQEKCWLRSAAWTRLPVLLPLVCL